MTVSTSSRRVGPSPFVALNVLCSVCREPIPLVLFANSPVRPRRACCPGCGAVEQLV